RAIAVDTGGRIYAADWNRTVARFDPAGNPQYAATLPNSSGGEGFPVFDHLTDIDFVSYPSPNDGGLLAVGSNNGTVGEVSGQFFSLRTTFSAGTGPVFVASGPSLVEVSISGPSAPIPEGDSGPTPATFTVSLSNPSPQPVYVNWATTTGGTATANV